MSRGSHVLFQHLKEHLEERQELKIAVSVLTLTK